MPIAAVDIVGPHEGAYRAIFLDAAVELLAGEVDVVDRQHRCHLELVGAVLAEIVQPVVVSPADRRGELRVHVVTAEEGEPHGREQHRDVDPFHLHAQDLRLGVVAALDREHHVLVGATRDQRPAGPVVLRDVAVVAERGAVEEPQGAAAHAGAAAVDAALRGGHPVLKGGVEIIIEQVDRFHDVHVAIDKPMTLFHDVLLSDICERTNTIGPRSAPLLG